MIGHILRREKSDIMSVAMTWGHQKERKREVNQIKTSMVVEKERKEERWKSTALETKITSNNSHH